MSDPGERSGSSRSASSGAVTQGTPAQSTPGACAGRGGQQLQPFGGAPGGGEQVGAGDDRADEGVVVEREEVEAAAARGGEPGQRLVHLGQGGGLRQRAGEVAGGVVQVALVECQPGQRQLLRRRRARDRPFPRARRPLDRRG